MATNLFILITDFKVKKVTKVSVNKVNLGSYGRIFMAIVPRCDDGILILRASVSSFVRS